MNGLKRGCSLKETIYSQGHFFFPDLRPHLNQTVFRNENLSRSFHLVETKSVIIIALQRSRDVSLWTKRKKKKTFYALQSL